MFAKALIVGVFAAFAAAQGTTSSTLSFTRVPNPITAGKQEAILYATSDSSAPVTILLRKGNPNDLDTVATLTTTATNGQYIWNVDTSLENGSDYALEIKQGDQLNYYGPFVVQGGGQASDSSSSSSSSSTGSVSSTAVATITASHNSSAITTATISSGTGVSMPRNTTMSSATLSRTSSGAGPTSSSNDAGFQGSRTSSGTAPTSTGAASSLVATGSSALALAFGAVAAVFFC